MLLSIYLRRKTSSKVYCTAWCICSHSRRMRQRSNAPRSSHAGNQSCPSSLEGNRWRLHNQWSSDPDSILSRSSSCVRIDSRDSGSRIVSRSLLVLVWQELSWSLRHRPDRSCALKLRIRYFHRWFLPFKNYSDSMPIGAATVRGNCSKNTSMIGKSENLLGRVQSDKQPFRVAVVFLCFSFFLI